MTPSGANDVVSGPVRSGTRQTGQPSDDMIVLAAVIDGQEWRMAEDIASTLRRLGIKITPQKMAGTLKRLCAEDSPMFEARDTDWRLKSYRVTRFGWCRLVNRFTLAHALRRGAVR